VSAPAKAPAIVRRLVVARLERLQQRQRKIVEELRPTCKPGGATESLYDGEIIGLQQGIAALKELLEIPELADGGGS
jgi:hypothetical protein